VAVAVAVSRPLVSTPLRCYHRRPSQPPPAADANPRHLPLRVYVEVKESGQLEVGRWQGGALAFAAARRTPAFLCSCFVLATVPC